MKYFNSEMYDDPTAGKAIERVMKRYRVSRRDIMTRPKVYAVSPYRGNTVQNSADAVLYCRYVIEKGYIPVAGHLMYPQILDDNDPEERELGMMFGLSLMMLCDEVWVFGTNMTYGMRQEINEARHIGIPVRYISGV